MNSVADIILYSVIAIVIVVFSGMTVFTKKILRSATYLLFVLLATAVLYFQLGYQFLGAVQIAVYAGGIMVLFVFAILLTHKPDEEVQYLKSHRRFIGGAVAVCGGILLLLAIFYMPIAHDLTLAQSLEEGTALDVTMKSIGRAFTGTDKFQYLLPFEAISILLLACIIGGVTVARKR